MSAGARRHPDLPDAPPIGLLLDLDRTLIDVLSFTDYGAALNDVRRMVGVWHDVTTPETGWDGPTRACMAVLVALSGDPRWQQVSDAIEHHELSAVAASVPMPYLADALEATAPLRRAVVTLLPRRVAVSALTRHGIPIDHVIPRRPELRPKPAPDQVNAAVALLEVDRSALVMVGDSSWDEEASHAAGVAFIGLRNGGRSEFSPATPTVDHLGELVQLFQHRWYG